MKIILILTLFTIATQYAISV